MSHAEQLEYVKSLKKIYPSFFNEKKVLEVGSLDINGSIRQFFDNCDYLGIDIGKGPGVDVVSEGQKYDAPNDTFDVSCSAECFEHNPYWLETFLNMIRVTKPNGMVFFTCATDGRPEHGTTRTDLYSSPLTVEKGWEYYMNLNEKHFTNFIDFDKLFVTYSFAVNGAICDLYFFGIKK